MKNGMIQALTAALLPLPNDGTRELAARRAIEVAVIADPSFDGAKLLEALEIGAETAKPIVTSLGIGNYYGTLEVVEFPDGKAVLSLDNWDGSQQWSISKTLAVALCSELAK